MPFQCAARTDVGRRRKINEDAIACRPDLGLWVVADGMGGHDAGEVASALVVERLIRALEAAPDPAARVEAARAALAEANAALVALGGEGPDRRTIGSTVVALVDGGDGRLTCLWAGDSRAYRLDGAGLTQISRDHSLVQDLVEAGVLTPEEAPSHPNANVITRAVGASPRLLVDGLDAGPATGAAYLLASDGLTRLASDAELAQALAAADLDAAADDLLTMCLERGAPDNVSLVMMRG